MANKAKLLQLQEQIIEIDEKIFESYDETVARVSEQKSLQKLDLQWVVILALLAVLASIVFAVMLFVVRTKVIDKGYKGIIDFYKELTIDFAGSVSPEKTSENRMLRVNVVVITGLILMSISVISYLITTL